MAGNERPDGEIWESLVVKACGCRSRFCPRCSIKLGIDLKIRLGKQIKKFGAMAMVSLTIDPEMFASPREAWMHVNKRRAVARVVAELAKRGHVASSRYFVVVEWQKNGWPHWHVLLESEFIPHQELTDIWSAQAPAGAALRGYGLGHCFISVSKFKNAQHAANYVGKYLTKVPEEGWPEWVLHEKTRVRRYSTSRGFWEGEEDEVGEGASEEDGEGERREMRELTIAQRVARCGIGCAIYRMAYCRSGGKEHFCGGTMVRPLERPWEEVKLALGMEILDVREIPIDEKTAELLVVSESQAKRWQADKVRKRFRQSLDDPWERAVTWTRKPIRQFGDF